MLSNEAPLPALPPNVSSSKSLPFRPTNLFDLFFRPRRFFRRLHTLQHVPSLYLCAWLYGMLGTIQRLNRVGWEHNNNTRNMVELTGIWQAVSTSWLSFWLMVIGAGLVVAALHWWIGGWWYKTRIAWASKVAPDGFLARQVYFYSGLVIAAPALLIYVIFTLVHPDLATAMYFVPVAYIWLLALVGLWSIIVGYIGVRTCFDTVGWTAFWWIVGLPVVFNLIAISGLLINTYLPS